MDANTALKLYGMWASPYAFRVRMAFKLKGIEYEYVEENLSNKSSFLLQYNPIYGKVPVLLHGDRPLAESVVIMEYVDEVWKDGYQLFPSDPYERAVVRFWCQFSATELARLFETILKTTGENRIKAAEEFQQKYKIVEDELQNGYFKGRKFFGGEKIGVLDIIFACYSPLLPIFADLLGMKFMNREEFPRLSSLFQDFNDLEVVKQLVPPKEKLRGAAEYVLSKAMSNGVMNGN